MPHANGLAYEIDGTGVPLVFLHGLTFDRRTWRPIIDRLGGSYQSIAIDLPAHGESGGAPAALDVVAAQIRELLDAIGIDAPIVVGHSMSAGLAVLLAAESTTRGVVVVDNGPYLVPFAKLAQQLEPVLRGPGFHDAWQNFERTLGLELIPEPDRSLVLSTHVVDQDVVVGYWDMMMSWDPDELQAWVDAEVRKIDVSCLGVFGHAVGDEDRERFAFLPNVQLEEVDGGGHFVHLVDPDRFVALLRRFVDHCVASRDG